ncbi:ribosomal protein L22 [Fomitiporia mediterranea MF3/22]|uniref:ribosomal protein L22 n=1 Tax=Fomitiporia mediterranea (strain MF3/22) TaxID=694068 RepID=UPI0004407E53|nr:ribosomal protein L22 [Fomitiporia mediterranea MF3/22]EJD01497.1 ribosomal protein L22 [Fomitiporia mediterranea MF3/22]
MQSSFINGLKTASRRKTRSSLIPAQPSLVASTSRTTIQWDQRRTAWFPTDWIRRTMSPQIREKDSEKEVEAARQQAKERGEASLFEYEDVSPDVQAAIAKATGREVQKPVEHRGATKNFWISHRKLNKLAHQISGKPIDSAILQMIFSEKRASGRIKSMLAQAKSSAVTRGMDSERLVVSEAWVNKGKGGRQMKRLEIKGRGRIGIRTRYNSKMVVMLREGLTFEEKRQRDREARLKRIVSSGLNREDVPLRNPSSQWAW